MITPRWLDTRIQPIAIRDVLRYLVGCAAAAGGRVAQLRHRRARRADLQQMMQRYARVAGLRRRLIVPVPVLTPTLSSHWVGLVTPVPNSIARPLVESLGHEVVCGENDIADYVPDPPDGLLGFDRAVELALQRIKDADVATRWSSAARPARRATRCPPTLTGPAAACTSTGARARSTPPPRRCGGSSRASAASTAGTRSRSPGGCAGCWTGWSAASGCAAAGATRSGCSSARPSTSGGSRSASEGRCCGCAPRCGCPGWPGSSSAWSRPATAAARRYDSGRVFHPRGLLGHLYWWSVAPFHGIVFGGMARNIAAAAESPPREHHHREHHHREHHHREHHHHHHGRHHHGRPDRPKPPTLPPLIMHLGGSSPSLQVRALLHPP